MSQETARQQLQQQQQEEEEEEERMRQWLDQKQLEQDHLFRRCAQTASELLAKYKETESVPVPEEYARQLSLIFQEELLKTITVQNERQLRTTIDWSKNQQ